MRAILINSHLRVVTEVEVSDTDTLKDWYRLIECSMVEVAYYINKHDSIMVDEEGLLNEPNVFFEYEGAHQPFAGNGLVVGVTDEGESISCRVKAKDVLSKVKFLSKQTLKQNYYDIE